MRARAYFLILVVSSSFAALICASILYGARLKQLSAPTTADANVFWPIVARRGDRRAFVEKPSGKDAFRIALITGSSGKTHQSFAQGGRPTSEGDPLCDLSIGYPLQAYAPTINGRKTEVYNYLMIGGRLPETLMAVKDAIARLKPDILVVGISGMMLYNDRVLLRADSGRRNWNSEVLEPPFAPGEFSNAARLVKATDIEFALTRFIKASARRSDLSRNLKSFVSLFPTANRELCQDRPIPREGWDFATLMKRTAGLMGTADSTSVYARNYTEFIIDHAAQSGLPVYFYAEPINPNVRNTPIEETLKKRLSMFGQQIAARGSTNILFDPETLFLYERPEFFTDYVHPVNADPLALRLAQRALGVASASPSRFTEVRGRQLVGHTLKKVVTLKSSEACAHECSHHSRCVAYSFEIDVGRQKSSCLLTDNPELTIRNARAVTGFASKAPHFDIHVMNAQKASVRRTIDGVLFSTIVVSPASLKACSDHCRSHKCRGFTLSLGSYELGRCQTYSSVKGWVKSGRDVVSVLK